VQYNHWIASGCAFAMTGLDPFETPSLNNAIKKFPDGTVPKDRDEREELVEKMENENDSLWDSLDESFYQYEEDIYSLMIDYIKNNIKEFR
jgi:hypothetical protein